MYSASTYGNVRSYAAGESVRAEELSRKFEFQIDGGIKLHTSEVCSLETSTMLDSEEIVKWRFNSAEFSVDMRDVLAEYGNKLVQLQSVTVGRVWKPVRKYKVFYSARGLDYGSVSHALSPAVAPITADAVTAGSLGSWGLLHSMLGGTGTAPARDGAVVGAVAGLHKKTSNSVRFTHRLAALYCHGLINRGTGGERVRLVERPDVVRYEGFSTFQDQLNAARIGVGFVPLSKVEVDMGIDELGVLLAAGSSKVRCEAGGAVSGAALSFWPELEQEVRVIAGATAGTQLRGVRMVDCEPATVWRAAQMWLSAYGSLEVFDEAVEFIMSMVMSPVDRQAVLPCKKLDMELPGSDMAVFVGDGILEPVTIVGPGLVAPEPPVHRLAMAACMRAMVLGVSYWTVAWKVAGYYDYNGFTNQRDLEQFMKRFRWGGHCVPAMETVNYVANEAGVQGNLGRLYSTLRPHDVRWWANMSKYLADSLQWEELLLRVKATPLGVTVHGNIFPLRLDPSTAAPNEWWRVAVLPAGFSAEHAWGNMVSAREATDGGAHGVEVSLLVVSKGGFSTSRKALRLVNNYAGRPAEFQLLSGVAADGAKFEPVFRIRSRDVYDVITGRTGTLERSWYRQPPGDRTDMLEFQMPRLIPWEGADRDAHRGLARGIVPAGGVGSEAGSEGAPQPGSAPSESSGGTDGSEVDTESETEDTVSEHGAGPDGAVGGQPVHPAEEARTRRVAGARRDKKDAGIEPLAGELAEAGNDINAFVAAYPDLGTPEGRRAATMGTAVRLLGHSQPAMQLAQLACGTGLVRGSAALPGIDAATDLDIYDVLKPLPVGDRARAAAVLRKVYHGAVGRIPFGETQASALRKMSMVRTIEQLLSADPSMDADEWEARWGVDRKVAAGYFASAKPDAQGRRDVTVVGRLPSPEVCKQLVSKGLSIDQGVVSKGSPEDGAGLLAAKLMSEAAPSLDGIDDLVRVIVASGKDAGNEQPEAGDVADMLGLDAKSQMIGRMIEGIIAEVYAANAVVAAAEIQPSEEGNGPPASSTGGGLGHAYPDTGPSGLTPAVQPFVPQKGRTRVVSSGTERHLEQRPLPGQSTGVTGPARGPEQSVPTESPAEVEAAVGQEAVVAAVGRAQREPTQEYGKPDRVSSSDTLEDPGLPVANAMFLDPGHM